MIDSRGRHSLRVRWFALLLPLLLAGAPSRSTAQERTGFIVGEPQGLEMMVHVIGEVQKPGEYRVRDRTDLLQLISKAGGPTQFSRLNGITVRRTSWMRASASPSTDAPSVEIIQVNLDKIMRDKTESPPLLQPGDVVFVPKNKWHRWRDASAVARDLSVIASAYFLYLRATKN
jgi:hypothetical protein